MQRDAKAPKTCGTLIHIGVPLQQILKEMGLHDIAAMIAAEDDA